MCLENSPSDVASASAWGCRRAYCGPHCGNESVRVLPSLLGPSPSGVCHHLVSVPRLEALSESLTHSIPRSFLVVALSASAVGFAVALWLCPERALCLFFASVSLVDPVALSPLSRSVSADGFRHWWAFRSCGGVSPHALGSVGALGELRWLHLYCLTPDLVGLRHFAVCRWSSGRCFVISISILPSHIYSTRLSHAKVTCNTHTPKKQELLSIPLKLVPSLAKLPSLTFPLLLGGVPPPTQN